MSPVYTDEIKMLIFDDICFHAGHHQNKQQNNSQRQQEDLQQLWIDIPTGKSLGVAKNLAEAWEFKWPGNCSSSEGKCVLDCLKWIADPYLIWEQLLPQLVTATSVLSQLLAPRHTKKIVKNWTTKWQVSCLFGFHLLKAPIQARIHL